MPDTGLPWVLPYPADSDLVRDGAQAIEDLADAVAAGLSSLPIQQVIQTVKTDTFTTASATYVDVTGLTVTITPSSTSSKVLVICEYTIGNTGSNSATLAQVLRDSTVIYKGDDLSSRVGSSGHFWGGNVSNGQGLVQSTTNVFLDSPAADTATVYKLQLRAGAGTATLGRSGADPDSANGGRTPSSITVIEVAA